MAKIYKVVSKRKIPQNLGSTTEEVVFTDHELAMFHMSHRDYRQWSTEMFEADVDWNLVLGLA